MKYVLMYVPPSQYGPWNPVGHEHIPGAVQLPPFKQLG